MPLVPVHGQDGSTTADGIEGKERLHVNKQEAIQAATHSRHETLHCPDCVPDSIHILWVPLSAAE